MFIIVLALFLILPTVTFAAEESVDMLGRMEYSLSENPEVETAIWIQGSTTGLRFFTNRCVWVKVELPDAAIENPEIFIYSYFSVFRVFADGKEIFRSQTNAGLNEAVIPIPQYTLGKVIYFKVWYEDLSSIRCLILRLASHRDDTSRFAAYYRDFINDNLITIAFGIVFVLIAVISTAVFVIRRKKDEFVLMVFAFFALSIAANFFCSSGLLTAQNESKNLTYFLSDIVMLFFPAFSGMFFSMAFARGMLKKVIDVCWIANLSGNTVIIILIVFQIFPIVVVTFQMLLIVEFFTSLIVLADYVRRMKRGLSLYLLISAIALMIIFFVLAFLGVPAYIYVLGTLYFILVLFYIVISDITARDRELIGIQEELTIAARIQKSLIPKSQPQVERLRIASRYIPMTAVAGDFYDYVTPDSKKLGILIADVSGHGVPAALIASMVKVAFHSQSGSFGVPSKLMASVNNSLYGRIESQFLTAGYLLIDTDQNTIRYVSAAHPALIRYSREEDTICEIKPRGTVVGCFPDLGYPEYEGQVRTGDILMLYTDGVVETENIQDEQFGEERLMEFIHINKDLGPDALIDALLNRLRKWNREKDFRDDITVIVVEMT